MSLPPRHVRRIGLFGGTFDPPHIGHMEAAQAAFTQLRLQHLIFIPGGMPPHKGGEAQVAADAEHRYQMVRQAIAGDERFSASRVEIDREGPSFTVDTVRDLTAHAPPDTQFYFILGDDCAANLHRWKGLDYLLTRVTFVSVARRGAQIDASIEHRVLRIDMPTVDVSSSQLRRDLAANMGRSDKLPTAVSHYIAAHGLYGESKKVA